MQVLKAHGCKLNSEFHMDSKHELQMGAFILLKGEKFVRSLLSGIITI